MVGRVKHKIVWVVRKEKKFGCKQDWKNQLFAQCTPRKNPEAPRARKTDWLAPKRSLAHWCIF